MTGNLLLEILQGMNEEQRSRPVYLMVVGDDGVTSAERVVNCFASQPYDGELIWIVTE